ncbi:DUF805 domain-containing protein [Arcicella aquatica]|uniref:DUF805 domain-containing protein n=1 Tax=Arcicella aquatica TaxID=217141 RepID=A0ABU5QV33_9BACT|nr:DUF805 domain-containing protein [Arcicella aquatica]MEA5260559.1 DUF805 domain-containing protein [Arcicella aquatica]
MNYYLQVLQNYATFSGRARRSEYWYFMLFNTLFCFIAAIICMAIYGFIGGIFVFYMVSLLYQLIIFIPSIAVIVRRLHDIGKSGWYFLVSLIPVAGAIWLLVLLVTEGEPYDNQYGPNPKAVTDELMY